MTAGPSLLRPGQVRPLPPGPAELGSELWCRGVRSRPPPPWGELPRRRGCREVVEYPELEENLKEHRVRLRLLARGCGAPVGCN